AALPRSRRSRRFARVVWASRLVYGCTNRPGRLAMALARVVSFNGVTKDRMEEMKREMSEGERPEDIPATEMLILHDPEAEESLAILFFENEDDYRRGDATVNAMPAGDTPGSRTGVRRYDVALRMTD